VTLVERLAGGEAGQEIDLPLDLIVTDDWTTPSLVHELDRLNVHQSAVPVVLVHDHTLAPSAYASPAQHAERDKAEHLRTVRDAYAQRFHADVITGEGIQHHVLFEQGRITRDMRVLGNDSHTPTLGAYGALAFAGQPATVARAVETGVLPLTVPSTFTIELDGMLPHGVTVRDAVLTLLGLLCDPDGIPRRTIGRALQFQGIGLEPLSPSERALLANMAPEAVAATSVFAGDSDVLPPDLTLDLSTILPVAARSPSPRDAVSIDATQPATRVHRVFVGTCAGGTEEEIRAFATHLETRLPPRAQVACTTVVAPATRSVALRLEADGTLDALRERGVQIEPPGCSACFGFGLPRLEDGEVAVTTGNRNARGRMGSAQADIHLTSGASAGAIAATGQIHVAPRRSHEEAEGSVTITWPERGNVIRIHGVVTTDDLTPSSVPGVGSSNDTNLDVLRQLLFHHVDPSTETRDLTGCILVADHAFGMGSNRASSIAALVASGITGIVARSIAPVYAMGARDAGLAVHLTDDARVFDAATPNATFELTGGRLHITHVR